MSTIELVKLVFFSFLLIYFGYSGITKMLTAKDMPRNNEEEIAAYKKVRDRSIRDMILGFLLGGFNVFMLLYKM